MENEIWKIANYCYYDGRILIFNDYMVSNYGNVKSIKFGKEIILKPRKQNRYYRVVLYLNATAYSVSIHRLVASTFPEFCGEWFKGAVCNHKDENPNNNIATNIEIVTQKENVNYGTAIKRRTKKTINGKKAYKVIQMDLGGNFVKEWPSTMEIERVLGYANSNIGNCCRCKYKQAYGYIWRYKKGE